MPKRARDETSEAKTTKRNIFPFPVWSAENYAQGGLKFGAIKNSTTPEPFMGYYSQHIFVKVDEDTPTPIPATLVPKVGDLVAPSIPFSGVISFTHDPAKAKFPLADFKVSQLADDELSKHFFSAMSEYPVQLAVSLRKHDDPHIRKLAENIKPIVDPEYNNMSLTLRKNNHGEMLCNVVDHNNEFVAKYEQPMKTIENAGVIRAKALVKGYVRFGRIVAKQDYSEARIKMDVDLMKIDTSGKEFPVAEGGSSNNIVTAKKIAESTKDKDTALAMLKML